MEKLFPIHLIFRFFFICCWREFAFFLFAFNILIFCYKCLIFVLDFDEVILIGIAGIPAAFVTISDDKTEINEWTAIRSCHNIDLINHHVVYIFIFFTVNCKKEKHPLMNHDRQVKILLISNMKPTNKQHMVEILLEITLNINQSIFQLKFFSSILIGTII